MKRPSFQFYPGDWLNDAALRACSVGARGLWIDLICLMHQGSEYGHLKVNLVPILPANLARMVGATLPEVEGWIAELESYGVFSRCDDGCIFSRRMIRDEKIRESRASGGKLGGNPALIGTKKDNGKGGGKVESKVNLPPNLPPTPSSSSSSSSSSSLKEKSQPPDGGMDSGPPSIGPEDPIKAIFDQGVAILTASGKSEQGARSLIGRLRKTVGDEDFARILVASRSKTDPAAYMAKAAQPKVKAVSL